MPASPSARRHGREGLAPPPAPPIAETREVPRPSRESLRGLDWFTFFVADVQTGFGPFMAVYLTANKWTQVNIGLVLTIGGLVALAGQIPGGALVDAARSERRVAAISLVLISMSALALALVPVFPVVLSANVVHAAASCVLGPAIVAISLGLVGHAGISERLGRNVRFLSIGNGLAAAGMGACGYFLSKESVFYVTAVLSVPALYSLARIREAEIDPVRAHAGVPRRHPANLPQGLRRVANNRPLVLFAACIALFHLANAAMLPLVSGMITMRSSNWATVLVAACIVVPQLVVATFSPRVGRAARHWGRRPLLLLAFAVLPVRGILLAVVTQPFLLCLVQALDGISAAVLGVLVPVVIADLTRNTGRFNLSQGVVGTGVGIGASLSTTIAGYLADRFGGEMALLGLSVAGSCGLLLFAMRMPETRPADQ
ncbi:MAG: MFS transporter [Hyphomicrobiales bacterium]|nr:MFS transporter [Hyphomicrobiales bacterium]MBV9738937.1 MFS transporter [Hyphomicrobiales bacterium]